MSFFFLFTSINSQSQVSDSGLEGPLVYIAIGDMLGAMFDPFTKLQLTAIKPKWTNFWAWPWFDMIIEAVGGNQPQAQNVAHEGRLLVTVYYILFNKSIIAGIIAVYGT